MRSIGRRLVSEKGFVDFVQFDDVDVLDLGYMMNMAMFQRNGRAGYILKPKALRPGGEELFGKYTKHVLDITVR